MMHLPALSSLLAWVGAAPDAALETSNVKNVAIVGESLFNSNTYGLVGF